MNQENAEEPKVKRFRGSNFSSAEKGLLINVAYEYKDIIEDKKTDRASTEAKNKAWADLTKTFNANNPSGGVRSQESLKTYYKNKKKEVRQAVAKEKISVLKTGGGPEEKFVKDPTDEIILSMMNKKTVYGLENTYDSDGQVTSCGLQVADTIYEVETDSLLTPGLLEDALKENAQTNTTELMESHSEPECTQNTTNMTLCTSEPGFSQNNTRRNLVKNITPRRKGKFDYSRRRPATVVKALTTSELSEKYSALVDKRLEIAEYQKKILEIQLKIEEERLKKLSGSG